MTSHSMLEAPAPSSKAQFADGFEPRVLLTVDTEEEFDWSAPFTRENHGLTHVLQLGRFQAFCEELGARPVYLVDWPIANDEAAIEIIGDAVKRNMADIGVQLHPWVNPPFEEQVNQVNSYAGNLPPELEFSKFNMLRDQIESTFETSPRIYRAGRYGLGPASAAMLKAGGIQLDSSVRSLFDYRSQDGPDYSSHPLTPYWVDDERKLLELPVTSVYWGILRQLGPQLQRLAASAPVVLGGLAKLGLLERIALTPEGVTADEAIRGIDIALDDGLPLLVLSFHSPSLAPGHTPYTRFQADVEALYEWFHTIYAYLDQRGVRSTSVDEILAAAIS
ncbi:MAG: polysaccharide deacetylase family protein [Pseudomonadota bacterium]